MAKFRVVNSSWLCVIFTLFKSSTRSFFPRMRTFSISQSHHWLWLITDLVKTPFLFCSWQEEFRREAVMFLPAEHRCEKSRSHLHTTVLMLRAPDGFCFLGVDNEKTLIFFPKFDPQFGFLSKSWDFSYLDFTFSFACAALANRGSRSRAGAGAARLEQENTGTFPVLQELLWLLCIFKGLTLSHGEPL